MSTRESIAYDVRQEREQEWTREQFLLAASTAAEHVHNKRCDDRPAHECCLLYRTIFDALYWALQENKIGRDEQWRFIERWAP